MACEGGMTQILRLLLVVTLLVGLIPAQGSASISVPGGCGSSKVSVLDVCQAPGLVSLPKAGSGCAVCLLTPTVALARPDSHGARLALLPAQVMPVLQADVSPLRRPPRA